jgi:hypothetical protein
VSSLIVFFITFVCIVGGIALGMYLRTLLPDHHLSDDSKDVIKLGTGMIATLAALVLGLLIASAKGNFDTMNNGLVQVGAKIVLLDRLLAQYGPETKESRDFLRRGVATTIDQLWPSESALHLDAKAQHSRTGYETIQHQLRQLSPKNDDQRWLKSQALQVSEEIAAVRWFLVEQRGHSSLPKPLVVLLAFWLVLIFFIFGLLSPRNKTAIVVLIVCALSASASLYMLLELDNPFGGVITVSSEPLRNALTYLGQ